METHSDPIQYLENTLNAELQQIFSEKEAHLSSKFALFVKRKPNEQGDCHFPAFGRRMESLKEYYKDAKVDIFMDLEKIISSSSLSNYIKSFNFSPSTGQLNFRLNRVAIIKEVINNVIHLGQEYGKQLLNKQLPDKDNDVYFKKTNIFILNNGCKRNNDGEISLEYLRTLITIGHVKKLLSANGLQTQIMTSDYRLDSLPDLPVISEFLSMFDESHTRVGLLGTQDQDYERTVKDIEKMLAKCDKLLKISDFELKEKMSVESCCTSESMTSNKSSEVVSNACYLECEELSTKYSLQKVDINKTVIHSIASLEFNAKNVQVEPGHSSQLVHITSCNQLHKWKQNCMGWELLSSIPLAQNQTFMSLSGISVWKNGQKLEKIGAQELLKLREEQLRSAYLLKYGEIVQGPGWDQSISSMAVATIKLQIMAAAQSNQIKLDISDSAQDFRKATFVMYNCARLSKLFEHYEQSVEKGMYPPLPTIAQIDFSLLRDKEEWALLLRYVMTFPSTIRESIQGLFAEPQRGAVINANINKISCFLQGLSHDFSSYYRRVHVLGEPRPHLFPTMFARLYLLKAIQQAQAYRSSNAILRYFTLLDYMECAKRVTESTTYALDRGSSSQDALVNADHIPRTLPMSSGTVNHVMKMGSLSVRT